MESTFGLEIQFILPFETSGKFGTLFRKLDGGSANLGIDSYGSSVTTMDEIFLKVTEGTGP